MTNMTNKIFIGALIIFIDINIGIDLLPDFLGYMFIYSGLRELYQTTKTKDFYISSQLALLMIPMSIYIMFIPTNTVFVTISALIVSVSFMLVHLVMFYLYYNGILTLIDHETAYSDVKFFRNIYVSINMIFILLLTFQIGPLEMIVQTGMFIVGVILVTVSITQLFNLKKISNYFS